MTGHSGCNERDFNEIISVVKARPLVTACKRGAIIEDVSYQQE